MKIVHQLTPIQINFFDVVSTGNIHAIKDIIREFQEHEELVELHVVLSDGYFWRTTNPFSPQSPAISVEIREFMLEFLESVLVHEHEHELLLRWALRTYQSEEIIEELAAQCSPFTHTVERLTVIQEACFFYYPSYVEELLNISINCNDIWAGIENALFPSHIQRELLEYLKNYVEKMDEKDLGHLRWNYPRSIEKLSNLLLNNLNIVDLAIVDWLKFGFYQPVNAEEAPPKRARSQENLTARR